MSKTTTAPFSIADIEAQVATEETVDFEPTLPDGITPSGAIFKIKSDLAPSVDARLKEMLDQMKRQDQLRAAQAAKARPGEVIESTDTQDVFGRRLIAVRIAGWNLPDEFNEANLLKVLKGWTGLGAQILEKSAELARFTPTSSKV